MSRKKPKTASKAKATKSMKKGSQSFSFKMAETMEKDFRSCPSKIAAQYSKDLGNLRQQEKKLAIDLKKVGAKHKMAKDKMAMMMSKSANKKQMMASKKLEMGLNKIVADLTCKLEDVKNLCKMASHQHSKFMSLNKQMAAWEKEFSMKAKAMTAKPAKSKVRAKKAAAPVEHAQPSEENMTHMPEMTEMSMEETMDSSN